MFKLSNIFFLTATLWWVLNYYSINTYIFLPKNNQYFFNNLLNNPLNKYHPILFFITFTYMFNLTPLVNNSLSNRWLFTNKYTTLTNLSSLVLRSNFYLLLIAFSLYLGSWWALQEGSWGGWWNWDASEVFGLLILTLLLLILHYSFKYLFIHVTYSLVSTMPLIVAFVYLLLQMSYTIVSHNFGLSLLGYGYVHTFFITLLSVTMFMQFFVSIILRKITLYWLNFLKYTLYSHNYLKYTLNYQLISGYVTIILLTVLTVFIYINSFNPIINNIFWVSLSLDISNKWVTIFNLKIITLFLVYIYFYKFNSLTFINVHMFLITHLVCIQPVLTYYVRKLSTNAFTHLLLWSLLLTSAYLHSSLYIQWVYINQSITDWLLTYKRSQVYNNILFENIYVFSTYTLLNHSNISNANTFFWFHTSPDTQFFQLTLNESWLNQVIYNHTFMYLFQVVIIDASALLTDNIFSIIILSVVYLFCFKTKIIF